VREEFHALDACAPQPRGAIVAPLRQYLLAR